MTLDEQKDVDTRRLERIRNKPVMELTSKEIAMLTTREQRWVLDYRSEQRRIQKNAEVTQ